MLSPIAPVSQTPPIIPPLAFTPSGAHSYATPWASPWSMQPPDPAVLALMARSQGLPPSTYYMPIMSGHRRGGPERHSVEEWMLSEGLPNSRVREVSTSTESASWAHMQQEQQGQQDQQNLQARYSRHERHGWHQHYREPQHQNQLQLQPQQLQQLQHVSRENNRTL
ncbi:hypothetical protein F503_01688 [Ophiostoma piceae UAMH 11346]|uniref:Uncharacterized protein n=1 Tax=Ophiostoma piceae (strain UAMH 11346) TaxID=1262450 RepID=S3CNW1_OPHP1|nr:hypothetical protein F503_01688 [Ophiostoma piceae UAMH 11346]